MGRPHAAAARHRSRTAEAQPARRLLRVEGAGRAGPPRQLRRRLPHRRRSGDVQALAIATCCQHRQLIFLCVSLQAILYRRWACSSARRPTISCSALPLRSSDPDLTLDAPAPEASLSIPCAWRAEVPNERASSNVRRNPLRRLSFPRYVASRCCVWELCSAVLLRPLLCPNFRGRCCGGLKLWFTSFRIRS